ncbi:MAG: Maf family protein [Clostridia bacterium]|nr:Maf family protein [Clostridia bacterium]MDE7329210.1 Maf family protein [Clostridia bacterium]
MKVILASASPRRKELLSEIFDEFEVLPQNVDEKSNYSRPRFIAQDLAKIKLGSLGKSYADCLIISADTIVYKNGRVYGKPKDEAQAKNFLDELSGDVHFVYTGVAIYYKGKTTTFYDKSSVKFKALSEEEKLAYIASGSPMDKAGAYGIQDSAVVESYEGSYSNIVGLPMEKLKEKLRDLTNSL